MLERITGIVEGTEGSYILLRTGPVVLRLLAPAYFTGRVETGVSAGFHLFFQIQNEGNRGVPLAVAFPGREDREFFTRFITVSGIGVRAAAKAMIIPPGELAAAIAAGDLKALKSLPGIGTSRAKQIIAKLQDTFSGMEFADGRADEHGSAADARAILEQLGIPSAEAVSLVKAAVDLAGVDASPTDLVREAMKAR